MESTWNDHREWLETDGLGGFASGTVGGIRTRRYHGLLLASLAPPTNRFMLVNGIEAIVTTPAGAFPISTQRYDGQVVHPDGFKYLRRFTSEPWPTWHFELPDGTSIRQELFVRHGAPITALAWRLMGPGDGVTVAVSPLLSGRDMHALHHENGSFRFDAAEIPGGVRWQPYASVPGVSAYASGRYDHAPRWYRRFFYQEEWLRGFDAAEDLASPGTFTFDLSAGEASLILAADGAPTSLSIDSLREAERHRRGKFATPLHRAADQYIVRRGEGRSIIAGYPWFGDWGRDTFIAMRGLCLSTGRLDVARDILLAWAPHVSQGMLPNRFPDRGEAPEYNSVDASLWYVIATFEFLRAADRAGFNVTRSDSGSLLAAVQLILTGYADGTRFGIRADADGLLAAGAPGLQLTWMDARSGGREVTPRCGKPVEVQALWLNALASAANLSPRWRGLLEHGRRSFGERFWNPATGSLFDVIDVDHQTGRNDGSLRPNQVFAVGGLAMSLLDGEQARRVVDVVERELWTPMGLRTLAVGEPHYAARYVGGPDERDAVYHQGTVWPWLIGPFVEAWGARARLDSRGQVGSETAIRRAHPEAFGRRGYRPHLGDRRRRCTTHAARVPISGVVTRRTVAAGVRCSRDRPFNRATGPGGATSKHGTCSDVPMSTFRARIGIYAIEAALLGMFMVSACAVTALLEHPASPIRHVIDSALARRATIGAAMGVTAVLLIYSPWGRRSGAHMNPAVTLGFLRLGKIHLHDAAGYVAAQFVGGALGVALMSFALGPRLMDASVNYVATVPGSAGPVPAWVGEFTIALLMMTVVLQLNRFPRLAPYTGWFAGALVALYITFEAPLSGMSLNPARTLGSAVVGRVWTALWIYFTAPTLGMLAAVELHRVVSRRRHALCAKLSHCTKVPCIFKCDCLGVPNINAAS